MSNWHIIQEWAMPSTANGWIARGPCFPTIQQSLMHTSPCLIFNDRNTHITITHIYIYIYNYKGRLEGDGERKSERERERTIKQTLFSLYFPALFQGYPRHRWQLALQTALRNTSCSSALCRLTSPRRRTYSVRVSEWFNGILMGL